MGTWFIVAGILLAVMALYLFLIAPARNRPDASALVGKRYAHRGLHDGNVSVPENSMAAFGAAVDAGFGIELDVQLTKDGQMVVFHDGDLRRVCGADARVRDLTYEELKKHPLPNGSAIPLFSEVLDRVGGNVPLIVEVKHYGSPAQNTREAMKYLARYEGPYCVESFHPLAVRVLRREYPSVIRGQLAAGGKWEKGELNPIVHFAMKHLLVNVAGRPHFVAYSVPEDHTLSMWLMKRWYHPLLAAWTIRDARTLAKAEKAYQMPIFERFWPDH